MTAKARQKAKVERQAKLRNGKMLRPLTVDQFVLVTRTIYAKRGAHVISYMFAALVLVHILQSIVNPLDKLQLYRLLQQCAHKILFPVTKEF